MDEDARLRAVRDALKAHTSRAAATRTKRCPGEDDREKGFRRAELTQEPFSQMCFKPAPFLEKKPRSTQDAEYENID